MSDILITDGRYSHTLGIIRSLNKLGHKVDCIGHPLCLSSFSRSTNKCSYRQSLFTEEKIDRFIEFLDNKKYDYLIPVGARSVYLVNKFRKDIEKKTNINLAPRKSIEICLNKKELLSIARDLGIPVPKTYDLKEFKSLLNSGRKLRKKIVIKPSSELSDEKVVYLTNDDLRNYKSFDSSNTLIQEYINGSGVGFFAIYDHGKLKDFFMHERIRENPITGGSSVCAKSIYEPRLFKYGTELLNKLNWHGVAMVEFKKDITSGKYYLMEVNPKFWASHDLAISCGVNFAEKYLELSLDKEKVTKFFVSKPKYKINKSFQWLARDIKTNIFFPRRLLKVFQYLIFFRATNNLHLKDPLATLYLLIYAFFSPLIKLAFFRNLYSFFYKCNNSGLKTALIRTFSEVIGIPILKYSSITNFIALGAQPSKLGLKYLSLKRFKYILNVRSEFNYDFSSLINKFKVLNIPVSEFTSPTIKELDDGAEFINLAIRNNSKIYVHCREGISRAACFVVAYLIKYKGFNLERAIGEVRKHRYFINILKNQLNGIKKFERSINKKQVIK